MDRPLSGSGHVDDGEILIFAPTGNDGPLTAAFLRQANKRVKVCRNMADVCLSVSESCSMILVAEETLNPQSIKMLGEMLAAQPPWSDIPIVVITSGGEASQERLQILASLGISANVGLLERPFRRGTLLSSVEVALRARRRQRQVRQLLAEREQAQGELERTVQARTAELRETNAQLETLVYSIAHDLRAPLRSMQAFAKILLDDYAPSLDDKAVGYAQRIAKSAENMDTLVLDLLAYGKAARDDMELEQVDLEKVWQVAMDQYEQDIKDLSAVVTTVQPLPWVCANAATLIQILANLLGNALKFVPEGVTPVIVFTANEVAGRVRISIEDNGIGIPSEYHEKIFRVFERLRKDKTNGTGIGLAIVKKGAERMGGSAGLVSGPPRVGSLFWVELKAARAKL